MIAITLDRPRYATGGFVTATIRWKAEGGRRARKIIVAAEWETEGYGNKARGVARGMAFQPDGDAREAAFPVRFLIPYEGPISFKGELIAVVWKLRVRVDQMGLDEFAEAIFRVEPRRRKEQQT